MESNKINEVCACLVSACVTWICSSNWTICAILQTCQQILTHLCCKIFFFAKKYKILRFPPQVQLFDCVKVILRVRKRRIVFEHHVKNCLHISFNFFLWHIYIKNYQLKGRAQLIPSNILFVVSLRYYINQRGIPFVHKNEIRNKRVKARCSMYGRLWPK